MFDNKRRALIAVAGDKDLCILPEMTNRHGLITGATGTGKTCTLQNMAETFSNMGVPVFVTDIKGDLSGVGKPGGGNVSLQKSVDAGNLVSKGFEYRSFPVCYWDIFGEQGHPLRTTISEMGFLLLSRLLDLNDVQSGVLTIAFRIADDERLLLLDLKDLRKLLEHIGVERNRYTIKYGNISPASIGAIQRGLATLEEQGGDKFFGEPALDIFDFMQTLGGRGVIHILEADKLIRSPKIYTSFLLYLLSELFDVLPEVGDTEKPKLVFFFDEAHLLFDDLSETLLKKIEQVVRLVRSKGVGVYFCTQSPLDVPETILGQLGNRVQHALRAFTPHDRKAVSAAASTFRRNPAFNVETVITELAIGEALVSFLDEKGSPSVVERAVVIPPEGQAGPITADERRRMIQTSLVFGKYERTVDRESAFEILLERFRNVQQAKEDAERRKEEDRLRKEEEKDARRRQNDQERLERRQKRASESSMAGSLGKMLSTKAKREAVNILFKFGRGLLGSLLKGK
jgi:DNA helicase HerA-like ATPase